MHTHASIITSPVEQRVIIKAGNPFGAYTSIYSSKVTLKLELEQSLTEN